MERRRPPSHDGPSQRLGASSTTLNPIPRLKTNKLSQIHVPSLSAFQTHNPKVNVTSPVRRKPLPPTASSSPVIPKFLPSSGTVVAVGDDGSADAQAAYLKRPLPASHDTAWLATSTSDSPPLIVRDLDQFPRGQSPLIPQKPGHDHSSTAAVDRQRSAIQKEDHNSTSPTRLNHVRLVSEPLPSATPVESVEADSGGLQRAVAMSLYPAGQPPSLLANGNSRSVSSPLVNTNESMTTAKPQKPLAPNMLTSFFGWKASSPIAEDSPTATTDRSHSPGHSPPSAPSSFPSSVRSVPHTIDVSKANGAIQPPSSVHPYQSIPPLGLGVSAQVEEMEDELRGISSELAGSIRREIELEEQIERLQSEASQVPDPGRRTSDYFSDSGTSSVRYQPSEIGGNRSEDLEKMKRRSEQEKAQLKLDTSQKLQDERGRRKALEAHVRSLENHLQAVEHDHVRSSSKTDRVEELEAALEDSRRRIHEERQGKENFEDLLVALRGEIEQHRNERDNLRDEVVPHLRARVEGLEAEAADFQRLTYEHTRMQQELASLKEENSRLADAKKLQLDLQQRSPRFGSIAEEGHPVPSSPTTKMGLTRSSSLARGMGGNLTRAGSLSRSNSISTKERESRESLADRVKDVELQRDSLHRALKSLLDRQKHQNREHEKRVKALESERDKALRAHSPRRMGYEKEVAGLRLEINHLRRRADDALEQKWQCEKGLGGLKKDLDRAEQETGSLRTLLHENDILIPEISGKSPQDVMADTYVTSASLERAYKELKKSQAMSIARLQELKGRLPSDTDDAKTQEAMGLLLKTMSDAEAERDSAQQRVEIYRAEAESLKETTTFHENETAGMAEQLHASANRMGSLASQVRYQLESNSGLRQRLTEAVGRGEREQKASADRINNMQGKLKALEDRLMAAQQQSEDAVQMHEDEIRGIRDSHNNQLQRLKVGLRTPTSLNPNSRISPSGSPRSPLFYGARSPRLDQTSSGLGISMGEALRTEYLEKRVTELEGALGQADKEMEEVVQRMNAAQIEVMELQSARDEAMRQTRKLQAEIIAEREKVDALMKPDSMIDSIISHIRRPS